MSGYGNFLLSFSAEFISVLDLVLMVLFAHS
jgi:hypothetical protein